MVTPEPRDITFRFLVADPQNLAIDSDPTEVWSTSPILQVVNTWTEMFHQLFQIEPPGKILWIYFYIKYRVRATTATADVDERIRARNLNGTYQNISDELATVNIGTVNIERITSGYVNPRTGGAGAANLDYLPFEIAIEMRTNEVDTGRLEVSSESYVRVVYEER